MITYPELIKLFGTPVSKIPIPHKPFRLTKTHYFFGSIIIGLAIYGSYRIVKDRTTLLPIKVKEKKE